MIVAHPKEKKRVKSEDNWKISSSPEVLNSIYEKDVNIVIYERDINPLKTEINQLLDRDIQFRSKGSVDNIVSEIEAALDPENFKLIIQDVKHLLHKFKEVSDSESFKLLLATVDSNMCRKFHTDINDLRMLCTYIGQGTLWLTDDNINQEAIDCCGDTDCIAIDESRVQQAETGAALILKGAIYPQKETKAAVHRSPSIEETRGKRLLLRIDTYASLNMWK